MATEKNAVKAKLRPWESTSNYMARNRSDNKISKDTAVEVDTNGNLWPAHQSNRGDYIDHLMREAKDGDEMRKRLYWNWGEGADSKDFSTGNPALSKVLTLYRFRPWQVAETPSLWEINEALDKGDFLLADNKLILQENRILEGDLKREKDANKILNYRITNVSDYSKKVEGWFHNANARANAMGLTLLVLTIISIASSILNLYFIFR